MQGRLQMHKQFLENLVHSNLYISCAAVAVSYATNILLEKPQTLILALMPFSIMFFIYMANRFSDLQEDAINAPGRVVFVKRHGKSLLFASLVLFLTSAVLAFLHSFWTFCFVLLPVMLGILYSFAGLKKFFLVKNLVVGLGWGCLPLINAAYYGVCPFNLLCFAGFTTGAWIVNSTVFDIKDIQGDTTEGIATLPAKWGIQRTKTFCKACNFFLALFLLFLLLFKVFPPEFYVLFSISLCMHVYIYLAKPVQDPIFYGFFVDGEFILCAFLLFLVT